jgi:signal peptidase II
MKRHFPRWYFWALLGSLLAADQISKALVLGNFFHGQSREIVRNFFYLTFVTNDGIAWGLFRGNNLLLGIAVSVFLLAAFWYARRLNWRSAEVNVAGAALLAGALGNLTDRFRLGYVVDFADFIIPVANCHWPAFNVADSCISLCVAWLSYRAFFGKRAEGAT